MPLVSPQVLNFVKNCDSISEEWKSITLVRLPNTIPTPNSLHTFSDGVQRFVVVFVTFLGVINVYLMRNSLGLIMTKLNPKHNNVPHSFTVSKWDNSMVVTNYALQKLWLFQEEYKWSSKLESFVHASFYIGYVLGHVPGGYLAERFGGKIVLNVGLFLTALFTAITPFVIQSGSTLQSYICSMVK